MVFVMESLMVMVGDGINDVFVFVIVIVGIVMGVKGLVVVIEFVDIVFIGNDFCFIFVVFVYVCCGC